MSRHNYPVYPDLIPLGRRVRVMRERAGLTLEQAALATDGNERSLHVHRVEEARENPTARRLLALARAFGCRVADFFPEEG